MTDIPKESGSVLGMTFGRNKNWYEFLTKGAKTIVLIAPTLGLKSAILKQAVFGHEYIHAYHRYLSLDVHYGSKYDDNTESSCKPPYSLDRIIPSFCFVKL